MVAAWVLLTIIFATVKQQTEAGKNRFKASSNPNPQIRISKSNLAELLYV